MRTVLFYTDCISGLFLYNNLNFLTTVICFVSQFKVHKPSLQQERESKEMSAEYILFFQSNHNLNCLNQISYDIHKFIRHCKIKIVFECMKIVISWRHMLGAVLWKIHKIYQTHYSKQTQKMCNKEMTICLKMGIISNDQPLSIFVSGILLFFRSNFVSSSPVFLYPIFEDGHESLNHAERTI